MTTAAEKLARAMGLAEAMRTTIPYSESGDWRLKLKELSTYLESVLTDDRPEMELLGYAHREDIARYHTVPQCLGDMVAIFAEKLP